MSDPLSVKLPPRTLRQIMDDKCFMVEPAHAEGHKRGDVVQLRTVEGKLFAEARVAEVKLLAEVHFAYVRPAKEECDGAE